MLSQMEDLLPMFHNQETNSPKEIDCMRYNITGQSSISNAKVVTLVTSRCSGSSYLNRVELQNGYLSLDHLNTFIPSTLGCSPHTGKVDQTKLKNQRKS